MIFDVVEGVLAFYLAPPEQPDSNIIGDECGVGFIDFGDALLIFFGELFELFVGCLSYLDLFLYHEVLSLFDFQYIEHLQIDDTFLNE